MPAARDDYIMRLITEAAAALRRLRERLLGGDSADEVLRDADTAIGTLLGPQRAMLDRLDAWSAANLLGDQQRLALWADLLDVKADATGAGDAAQRLHARATALRTHVRP